MVVKDLSEFGCVMQKDASSVVEVTSSALKESIKVAFCILTNLLLLIIVLCMNKKDIFIF
jgi:hypothetical protein